MQKNTPDRKIGLVTFNHEVTIIGDGTKIPSVIAGDKLSNFDYLLENGVESQKKNILMPIKDTKKELV